jgi:hypothetical protein
MILPTHDFAKAKTYAQPEWQHHGLAESLSGGLALKTGHPGACFRDQKPIMERDLPLAQVHFGTMNQKKK